MFDLSRYSQTDIQRTHDERSDSHVGVEVFQFRPYGTDFIVNRLGVSFAPPWIYIRFKIGTDEVLLCPLFLAQRGRLNLEVKGTAHCYIELIPGHVHTKALAEEYGTKILINRFQATMLIREALR